MYSDCSLPKWVAAQGPVAQLGDPRASQLTVAETAAETVAVDAESAAEAVDY